MTRAIALVLGIALLASVAAVAATAPDAVYRALSGIPLVHHDEIVKAFEIGFSLGRLSPDRMLPLVNRLAAGAGNPQEKEGILLVIAQALEDDLPVDLLVDKAEEGLARRVPLAVILNGSVGQSRILGLIQRKEILEAVRDLLYSKGIFSASGKGKAVATYLPIGRFDRIVTEVADVVCDYIESGGSPFDGHVIYGDVQARLETLSQLCEPPFLPEDAALVLARISAGDLTSVILKVLK